MYLPDFMKKERVLKISEPDQIKHTEFIKQVTQFTEV